MSVKEDTSDDTLESKSESEINKESVSVVNVNDQKDSDPVETELQVESASHLKTVDESLEAPLNVPPPSLADATYPISKTDEIAEGSFPFASDGHGGDATEQEQIVPEEETETENIASEKTQKSQSRRYSSLSAVSLPTAPLVVPPEIVSDEQDEIEDNHRQLNSNQVASEMFYDLIQTTLKPQEERTEKSTDDDLYMQLSERDQLVAFIEATLGALADDIEMGEREYISHKEAYFGMTYFFLQFCGFRIFLANIDEAIAKNKSLKELAHLIVEIVDNVANNAEYLHSDSDLPEHIAKNIIWQILNSNMMQRRYNEPGGVAQWQAADILDEILDTVIATEAEAVKTKFLSKPTQQSTTEMKTLEEPEICREYGGIFNVAEHFISSLFDKSSQIVSHHNAKRKESEIGSRPSIENSKPLVTKRHSIRARLSAKSMQNIDKSTIANPPLIYPQIENFTEKIGKYVINDIINKWKTQSLKEKWAFSIKFLMGQSDACSDFYIYEAVFGIPTPLYPVPQATCSLIFTIEVSRVKPRVCPINVSYKIEGSGYVFVPEEYVFQESWLLNVINAKIRLFSRVQF